VKDRSEICIVIKTKKMGSNVAMQLSVVDQANVLGAALRVVKEHGWPSLTISKVAEQIDFTSPGIYDYFPSNEDLISEVVTIGHQMLIARLKTARDVHTQPEDQLEAMWLAFCRFGLEERELSMELFRSKANGTQTGKFDARSRELTTLFIDVIRELTNEEEAAEEVSGSLLQETLRGIIFSLPAS